MSLSNRNILQAIAIVAMCGAVFAQTPSPDLADLKLEDLMNIEVTSVSKKEQKIARAASAIFVITRDDIRHSGADNIPDLLRMVPGVEVAQINTSEWAISVRGFNGQYSNKLLVLIDGRTIYSQMFSGVYWNGHDVPLEDIERIEVIRGAGATVWGANAVNGVINIITRKASATQGILVTAEGGTSEHGGGSVRYGGKLSTWGNYRLFSDGFHRGHLLAPDGGNGFDDWNLVHGGFRVDANSSSHDNITVEGDAHSGAAGEIVNSLISLEPPLNGPLNLRTRYSGWNLLTRWNHTTSERSETSLQLYFDRAVRGDSTYGFAINAFDIDFQHHFAWGNRQDIVWGLGYRVNSDATLAASRVIFTPSEETTQLFSSFIQNEIAVVPNSLYLTAGSKFEHNDYTGFGMEPSARIAWTPNARNTFWAAVSGAQRTPARSDTSVTARFLVVPGPNNLPLIIGYTGTKHKKAEEQTSVEAGYRARLSKSISIDSAAFFNHYDHLTSVEPQIPQLELEPSPPHLLELNTLANLSSGQTHGFEAFADWKINERWSINPGYSYLTIHIHRGAGSKDLLQGQIEGGIPNHQAQLRSHLRLSRQLQWNSSAYFVGALPAFGIASYTRLDSNLIWQAGERFSISLVGQNLLRDRHLEYGGLDLSVQSALIRRSAYIKLAWLF